MKIWLKKLFIIIITVMTLGYYVPPLDIELHADTTNNETESEKKSTDDTDLFGCDPTVYIEDLDQPEADALDSTSVLIEQAKERTIEKLGPRISTQLNGEMVESVLPNLELIITQLIEMKGPDSGDHFSIIDNQLPSYGEKIFDLYDEQTDQIMAKFHVRKENRPLEGYWFNFHYHLEEDKFEVHYPIADIYWSKDTPPKWMN